MSGINDSLSIFDTTLRDGGHCRERNPSIEEKLEIARDLESLNMDIMEVGFPEISEEEFDAVSRIGREIRSVKIAALCRAQTHGIESAAKALEGSKRFRLHLFWIPVDSESGADLPRVRELNLRSIENAVRHARKFCDDIQFSPFDATRLEEGFLTEMAQVAVDGGANVINISDSTGMCLPESFGELIHSFVSDGRIGGKAMVSVHCHNDLGLALANTLAAVRAGARQVECTVNGIGERAGNTALEELLAVLSGRQDTLRYTTQMKCGNIHRASETVRRLTGYQIQPNKAIVGGNAFRYKIKIPFNPFLKKNAPKMLNPSDYGY